MLSRKQIQFVNSLYQKKFRKVYNAFIAEGDKLVSELLHSKLEFRAVYATQAWLETHHHALSQKNIEIVAISEKELGRISKLSTPNQVLAVFTIPAYPFDPAIALDKFILMLDSISDPGNLGTILRTADWFGIYHIICSPDCVDLFNPKTVQATMGSIARMQVQYLDLKETLHNLDKKIPVYGSLLDGKPLTATTFAKNGILIIGNESHGISKNLHSFITHPISIPSAIASGSGIKRPESLNAAVATAILCWEIKRSTFNF